MDKPVIRPLTENDIVEFYGKNLGCHCKGWAVDYNGKLACIVGVSIMPTLIFAWSDVKPDLVVTKRLVWETAKQLMIKLKELNYPVIYAVAEHRFNGAPKFLKRLGWTYIESSARGEVFQWDQQ